MMTEDKQNPKLTSGELAHNWEAPFIWMCLLFSVLLTLL